MAVSVVAVTAVAAVSYGIYSGERAKAQARKDLQDAKNDAERARVAEEARQVLDKKEMDDILAKQKADQEATNKRLADEQTAAIGQVRDSIPGMRDQLGNDLLAQEEYAYKRMTPAIENRLNALGLLQSGALPEAQAKAQGDLEARRQAALTDFSTNALNTVNIQAPLAASSADISRQSDALRNNLDTAKTNLGQMFANENNAVVNENARQQYLASLRAGSNAANQASANAYMDFGSKLGSGALMYYGSQGPTNSNGGLYGSPSSNALYQWRQSGNTDYSMPMTHYSY